MNGAELKFLLKILKFPHYRTLFSKIDTPAKASEKTKICQDLAGRGLVQYSRKVEQFKIEPAGKAFLKQATTGLLSESQLAILKACETKSVRPSEMAGKKLPAEERDNLIQELESKGLLKVTQAKIAEVWLTQQGCDFLRDEFHPTGSATISLNLLGNYLLFLRQTLQPQNEVASQSRDDSKPLSKPSDDQVLQMIQELDQSLGTDNYLPIFQLRQKIGFALSRDELDQVLYRLQQQDKLEMSALVESVHYTMEQVQAGIPQDVGGPLFFLMVSE